MTTRQDRPRAAAWISDPYGWDGTHAFADQVHEQDHPTHAQLLGPDGRPLRYDRPPMGFDLRPREAKRKVSPRAAAAGHARGDDQEGGRVMTDHEKARLLNLRQRLRRAIKEGAEDHVLRDLIEDINETTDKLLNAREN